MDQDKERENASQGLSTWAIVLIVVCALILLLGIGYLVLTIVTPFPQGPGYDWQTQLDFQR